MKANKVRARTMHQPKILVVEQMPNIFEKFKPNTALKKQEPLAYKIDTAMWLQQAIISLAENILCCKRWQLLSIILKSSIAIVFNAYNLTMFAFDKILFDNRKFSPLLGCIFYGYQIFNAALDIVLTVLGFAMTFDEIENAARVANELSIYVTDESLRIRLLQFSYLSTVNLRSFTIFGLYPLNGSLVSSIVAGTTTYIIIFIQSGGFNELFIGFKNETLKFNNN